MMKDEQTAEMNKLIKPEIEIELEDTKESKKQKSISHPNLSWNIA